MKRFKQAKKTNSAISKAIVSVALGMALVGTSIALEAINTYASTTQSTNVGVSGTNETGLTFATIADCLTGNTIVNISGVDQNVKSITVKGMTATNIPSLKMWRVILKGNVPVSASDITVTGQTASTSSTNENGITFTTIADCLTGNTIVNINGVDQNVTSVTVKGMTATNIPSLKMWRIILTGNVTVSASDITVTGQAASTATTSSTNETGITFTTIADFLTGNTIVNISGADQNVTGITVKRMQATNIPSLKMWRVILTGNVPVSASDITATTQPTVTAPVATTVATPVTTQPIVATVNGIDMTKTVALKGLFGDNYIKVYLLAGITPVSITSDGTVLTYSATNGDYEDDIVYTGVVPQSANIVLTTTSGSQTYNIETSQP